MKQEEIVLIVRQHSTFYIGGVPGLPVLYVHNINLSVDYYLIENYL